jgi:transposase/predicted DNA-binding protein YlxM (UPF0122 family)
MIKMVNKQDIISLYRIEGKSLREISRELHLHRATVTKIIKEYESSLQASEDGEELETMLARVPAYSKRARVSRVMQDQVTSEIDYWLETNRVRRSKGMRKQCLNAKDIHRELQKKGLNVSYSSVCRYITKSRSQENCPKKEKDVFIRQEYAAGRECEFDWGEVKLEIAGVQTKFMMAVFTFCHSNGRYAYIFRHQDILALMESHRNFFRDVQGVPETMVYDNMRVAVAFDENGKNKRPTVTMQRLSNFYRFGIRFCNARAGWEKGHVERSVEIVRSRAFKSRVEFESIEEAQSWLTNVCSQLNCEAGSLSTSDKLVKLREDKDTLMPYPGEMGCFELVECMVDKMSTIVYKYSHYSVPDHLRGQNVLVKVYSEKLVIYDNARRKVAEHERSYVKNSWSVDINHFITTLMKKPGALEGSTALRQLPQAMRRLFHVNFRDNAREYLQLLQYANEHGHTYDEIVSASHEVKRRGARKLTADQIKVALHAMRHPSDIADEARDKDEFLEISLGSEDILNQLSTIMGQ